MVGAEVVVDFVVVGKYRYSFVQGLVALLILATFEMGLAEAAPGAGTLRVGCDRASKERVVVLPVANADGGAQR